MKVFKVYIIESNDQSHELETIYNVESSTWQSAVEKALVPFKVDDATTSLNISVSIEPTTEQYLMSASKK